MENIQQTHLLKIQKMLMEMAKGNLFYRLPRSGNQNTMEAMVVTLNMLAEEIQEALIHQGFVNSLGITKHLVQMHFLLDGQGTIEMVNHNTCTLLSYLQKDILGRAFGDFLEEKSKKNWDKFWKSMPAKGFLDASLDVTFSTREGLLISNQCHVNTYHAALKKNKKTVVTVIHYSSDRSKLDLEEKKSITEKPKIPTDSSDKKKGPKLSFEDIRKIREGRNVILSNLDQRLPSLKEFAHQLGTNEFKLKYGFRELFGTTVHRFLLQERLRKAKTLVQYTDLPLKSIAYQTGFKSIPHFSRVFKKTYGFAPSELRKSMSKPNKK